MAPFFIMARPKSINETQEALITVVSSLPGYPATELHIKIPNFTGKTIGRQKTNEYLEEIIKTALSKTYGRIK